MLQKISPLKIKKSKLSCLLLIGFFSALLGACTRSAVYEKSVSIHSEGWHFDSVAQFDVPIEDSLTKYNLILDLSYKNAYPYRNIFFFVDVTDPHHQTFRDTIDCFLSSPKGYSFGKKKGENIEQQLMYRYNSFFPNKGTYTFKFQHAMRDTLLKGFNSLGLKLVEFSEE